MDCAPVLDEACAAPNRMLSHHCGPDAPYLMCLCLKAWIVLTAIGGIVMHVRDKEDVSRQLVA